jgi:hypothetical protein
MIQSIDDKQVQSKIVQFRGQQVILDSDVAALYGVETRAINQAVKNNPEKFPPGYTIVLTGEEWTTLKSKILISKLRPDEARGGKVKLPWVFTEKGLYMLATILRSPQAARTTLAIVETFAKIRELSRTVSELSSTKTKPKQKSLMQKGGEIIADLLNDRQEVSGTETTFEIDLAVMKFKHIVKTESAGK